MSQDELLPLAEVKRRHVLTVLDACAGNRADAARVLDVDRKTLYRWLVEYGVQVRVVPTRGRVQVAIRTTRPRNDESTTTAARHEPYPDAATLGAPAASSSPWAAVATRQADFRRR